MSNKKPDEAPWLMPMITVSDTDKSLALYGEAFGFERGGAMQDKEGKTDYADMIYKGQMLFMMMPEGCFGGTAKTPNNSGTESGVALYVYCDDVDTVYAQAKQTAVKVVSEPEDMFWGDRVARFLDPDGHAWTFATKVGEFDESKIPQA